MRKNRYKNIKIEEITEAYYFQNNDNRKIWNFYDERKFIENLLQTRFNFLIMTYALFLGALFTAKEPDSKLFIIISGLVFFILMLIIIYRLYVKLDILLKIIRDLDKDQNQHHVANVIDNEFEGNRAYNYYKKPNLKEYPTGYKSRIFNVNKFIGIYIPVLMILSFLGYLYLLIFCGYSLK